MYTSEKRVCLNADRSKVVPCDSAEAAIQLVAAGGQIPEDEAKRYGLTDKPKAEAEPAQEPEEESKAVKEPPANKARVAAPENKGR